MRVRLLSGSQDGFRYRPRLSRLGLDEQEFLFDADAARTHLSDIALGSRFQPQQFIPSRVLPGGSRGDEDQHARRPELAERIHAAV
jgi:hypothetical protein